MIESTPVTLVITVLVLIVNFFLLVFVILNSRRTRTARYLILFLITMLLWPIFEFFAKSNVPKETAIVVTKIIYADGTFAALFFLLYCLSFMKHKIKKKHEYVFFAIAGILAILTLLTNFVVGGVFLTNEGYEVIKGSLFWLYFSFLLFCMVFSLYKVGNEFKVAKDRKKVSFLAVALLFPIALFGIGYLLVPFFGVDFKPQGSFFTSLMAITLSVPVLFYDM